MRDIRVRGARTAVMLTLAVALAGCSLVQSRTSGSTPKERASVERGDDRRTERTPSETAPGRPESDRIGQAVVEIALQYVGVPYRWRGASPDGFDCSGLVSYVYGRVGVALPHNAAEQYRRGTPVSRDDLQPGDVVFFDHLRHNGIYIGDGKFVHARKTGKHVGIARLDDRWYGTRWVGARRP